MIVNMEQKDYEDGFEEYIEGGLREEASKCYRCAVDLYYKALCQLIDFLLFSNDIIVGKLKERLDNVASLNSDIHSLFTIAHGIYRSAYKTKRDKTDCQEIKNGIKKIVFLKNVEGRFKQTAEKI
ncbi:hypothetical protein KY328_01450 [Candidatus Woesearchaeota archaeon]|nr:hypothetical protein [Candidatus Woesearchaeota archaeon]